MIEPRFAVCVVDDDASLRTSVTRLLSEHGYTVDAYESGRAFLERGPGAGACLLLVDVSMPDMDGLELVRRLRQAGRLYHVVFMSARDDDETRQRIAELGAIELIRKPFTADDLIVALTRARPLERL
jgi:FixJ family two-component response regulator